MIKLCKPSDLFYATRKITSAIHFTLKPISRPLAPPYPPPGGGRAEPPLYTLRKLSVSAQPKGLALLASQRGRYSPVDCNGQRVARRRE